MGHQTGGLVSEGEEIIKGILRWLYSQGHKPFSGSQGLCN